MTFTSTYSGATNNSAILSGEPDSLFIQLSWQLENEQLDSAQITLDANQEYFQSVSPCYWRAVHAYIDHDFEGSVRHLENCHVGKISLYTILLKSKALTRLGHHKQGRQLLESVKQQASGHPNRLYRLIYVGNLINPTQDNNTTENDGLLDVLDSLHFTSDAHKNYKLYCKGKYFHKQFKTDSALYYYNQVQKFATKQSHNDYLITRLSQKIGDIYYFKFNQTKSIYYYKKSLTIHESEFPYLKTELFNIYRNLAFFLMNTNKAQSLYYQTQAIELGQKINAEYHINANMEMAYLYDNHEYPENTEKYLLKSEMIANSKLNKYNPFYLDIYNQIFIFYYYENRNIFKALSYLELLIKTYKHLPEKKESYHYYMSNGILHLETGDYDLALEHFRTGLSLLNQEKGPKSPLSLPDDLNFNRHLTQKQTLLIEYLAKTFYLKYHNNSLALQDLQASFEYYNLLATYYEKYRTEIPEFYARISFENFRTDERKAILNNIKIALELYENTHEYKYLENAYEFMEKSRDMVLTNTIYAKQLKKQRNVPDSLIEQERALTLQIELISSHLHEKRSFLKPTIETDQFERLIRQKERISQKINTYFTSSTPSKKLMSIQQVQQQLTADQILIEYAIDPNGLYSFAITRDTVVYHRQNQVSDVIDNIHTYSKLLYTPPNHSSRESYKQFIHISHQLYTALIKPFESLMKDKTKLIVIPEDILYTIVFETLLEHTNDTSFVDYTSLPYMMNQYSISYGLSGTLYFENQANIYPRPIYAVAPRYPFKNTSKELKDTLSKKLATLPSLKGAIQEVNYLSREFSAHTADENLTEESFRSDIKEANILHLAMHSMIDPNYPEYNALILSPHTTHQSDGILHTYEIMNYELNNPLVVLSACNTGSGKLMTGEGIFSIAKGFIMAGSSGVITTFWEQNDASAFELMKFLYRNLYNEPAPAKALQQAKIQYLQQADPLKTHPYYWSGYILIGNPKLHHYNPMIIILVISLVALAFILIGFLNKRKK